MGTCWIALLSVLAISVPVLGNTTSPPCEKCMSVPMHYARLFSNGSVWDPVGRSIYPPGTYWLEDSEDSSVNWKYRGCPCKLTRPCLRKCCPVGEDMTRKGKCVPTEFYNFSVNVTDDDGSNPRIVDGGVHFALLFELSCSRFVLEPKKYADDEFFIRASNGYLSLPKNNINAITPVDFCLDYVEEYGDYFVAVCDQANPRNTSPIQVMPEWIVYVCSVAMLLSTLFLLATFFVYALIPDLRNTHGKSLMCHVSCLIMGYIFLSLVRLSGKNLTTNNCVASAFIIQFSFLAAFFWMNIMCVDIYIKFRNIRSSSEYIEGWENKKFLIYSAYSWGCPFIILMVSVIMDFAPGIPSNFVKPEFGKGRCWFNSKTATLAYFYGPVAVLLVCNVILFIITALKILKIKKETAILMAGESRRHDEMHANNKQRFIIYLKLFIVMGVNWIAEVISWTIGGPGYVWYLTDIGNTLQGVFIFLILVWKDRIRNILLVKLRPHPIRNRRQEDNTRTFWYSDGRVTSDVT